MATISRTACQPVSHQTANDREDDERVEVEAAEVGAHPAAPAEAVAVGDVGVERRPEEVEAEAHRAGGGAAVAGGGGVAELVEAGGQHGDARRRRGRAPGCRTPGPWPPPAPGRTAPSRRSPRTPAPRARRRAGENRTANGRGQPPGDGRVGDDPAEPQREQRIRPAELRLGPVGAAAAGRAAAASASTSCRTSSGAHQPSGRRADLARPPRRRSAARRRRAAPAGAGRQRDDLAVGAADQGGRAAVAGARHLPEQLHAGRPDQDLARRRAGAGSARPRATGIGVVRGSLIRVRSAVTVTA